MKDFIRKLPQCPQCKDASVRRSHRASLRDRCLSVLLIYPFRCEACGWRFRKLVLARS